MVVASGCYAQRAGDSLRAMPEVDLVAGNTAKPDLVSLVDDLRPGNASQPTLARRLTTGPFDTVGSGLQPTRNRAMVKIQEGCNQVCAYCIVPRVRGRERTVPPGRLVRQVAEQRRGRREGGRPHRDPARFLRLRAGRRRPFRHDRARPRRDGGAQAARLVPAAPGDRRPAVGALVGPAALPALPSRAAEWQRRRAEQDEAPLHRRRIPGRRAPDTRRRAGRVRDHRRNSGLPRRDDLRLRADICPVRARGLCGDARVPLTRCAPARAPPTTGTKLRRTSSGSAQILS